MFGLGDKTDDEIDAARGKRIAKYQKQSGIYQRKEQGYKKKAQNYRNGHGHGIGSLNIKNSSQDVDMAKQNMLVAKGNMAKAKDDMMDARREVVAKRVMDPKHNTFVLFNEKPNGWENVNGRNYQVKRSGKVTDQQLRRSVKRVYDGKAPNASDRGSAARTTYPPHPTARQLNAWERNPGRFDIRGIDAPNSAIITAPRTVTIPRSVQRQIGMRSANSKAKEGLSYGEIAAITDEWETYKIRHGGRGTPELAWRFIEENSDVYPEPHLQNEIFTLIGTLEEC